MAILPDILSDVRLAKLKACLDAAARDNAVVLAYSGGLDSRFLAFFAKASGFNVRLLHVSGPHVAPAETRTAIEEADAMGLTVDVLRLTAKELPDLAAAGKLRCYVCKKAIFTELLKRTNGLPLCDGTNHSDRLVYRPGRKALEELGIHSPLAEADITKAEIREIGRALGFRNPEQMARPCLLTRFPYGMKPTDQQLTTAANVEVAVEQLMAQEPGWAGLRFRCRYPDGKHPVLHVERASIADISDVGVAKLLTGVKQLTKMEELKVELVDGLSGYFDKEH